MSRKLRPLAAIAAVALIGAGCSNGSAENGTDSSDGNKNATKAMKFAECMRDHGVTEFPDPDASGGLTADGVLNGSSLDSSAPAWTAAMSACKDLEPAGFTGTKVSDEQQEARLEFAQCIRDNGVKDFPDPGKGDPMVDTRRIPSANEAGGMTVLNAAMQKCRDASAAAGVTGP